MICQEPVVTRRILQEAHTLSDAGYDVHLLTRSADTEDRTGEIEGIPTRWVAVKGRDPRFGWLYRLVGLRRGAEFVALWSVLTGRHTFTLRALPWAVAARADIYHAHDLNNLEVAYRAARANSARLVYDAHELFPDLGNRWVRLKRRQWLNKERALMPRSDLTITVNDFIAQIMARRNHAPLPTVVLNCPDPPQSFDPSAPHNLIREKLGIEENRKVVLYHGWIAPGRGLEDLVRAAPYLHDAAEVFLGYGDYRTTLEDLAGSELGKSVFFLPGVPAHELLPYCASADVGVIPYQAVDLNNYYSSPNKLFDLIQAGVPIVSNDLPFLRKVIAGNNLGVVAQLDNPRSYAQAINAVLTLPDGGAQIKANLRRVAPLYTWAKQAAILLAAYRKLK